MTSAGHVEQLRAVPLFAGLGDGSLERLAAAATELDFEPGQVLVQPNEPGTGMFVVLEGSAAVELRGRTVELGPGEFFGELSLLVPGQARSARVRAATPLRCLAIRRDDFTALLEAEPPLALAMLRSLAARLLDML